MSTPTNTDNVDAASNDSGSQLGSDVEEITKEEAEAFTEEEDEVDTEEDDGVAVSPPSSPTAKAVATATAQDPEPTPQKAAAAPTEAAAPAPAPAVEEAAAPAPVIAEKKQAPAAEATPVPTPTPMVKQEAIQIVSIGTDADKYAFKYHENAFKQIMEQIPDPRHTKISVVSVVGAFRTGKSFLLSWFLRYLDMHFGADCEVEPNEPSLEDEGDGNTSGKKWYEKLDTLNKESGFDWRGGQERNTTGIWMWSRPFLVTKKSTNQKFALLLVDTQGMFDHETTMSLTAAIFGLSTLLSSYQIYNVDKRIQEDHLQQLALFSEYGRIALKVEQEETAADAAFTKEEQEQKNNAASGGTGGDIELVYVPKKKKPKAPMVPRKPFQKIEFLVRDWQNFDDDDVTEENEDEIIQEMEAYLKTVLEERDAKDLKDTREQIATCFETISCFLLPHPGFAVTKKKYAGEVKAIEDMFLQLLDRYCARVFDVETLQAKMIHGRELTASELEAFMKAYAGLFAEGAHFPETGTMLEATATANNSNAISLSIANYKCDMDSLAGANVTHYVKQEDFEENHLMLLHKSLSVFDDIADFGSTSSIQSARERVLKEIDGSFRMYEQLNQSRNPLMGFELYIIPMTIALVSFALRWFADMSCSSWSETCRVSSHFLSEVYTVVFLFILIIAATKAKLIRERVAQIKAAFM